jgi:hypothetical protein
VSGATLRDALRATSSLECGRWLIRRGRDAGLVIVVVVTELIVLVIVLFVGLDLKKHTVQHIHFTGLDHISTRTGNKHAEAFDFVIATNESTEVSFRVAKPMELLPQLIMDLGDAGLTQYRDLAQVGLALKDALVRCDVGASLQDAVP